MFLALAIGDRNGGPIRMCLMLAESLQAFHGYNHEDIGARYLAWSQSGDAFDTGPIWERVMDSITRRGLTLREASKVIHDETRNGATAGINPAHRVLGLALATSLVPAELLASRAREHARLTHYHPHAGDAAAAFCRMVRGLATKTLTWVEALEVANQECPLPAGSQQPPIPGGYSVHVLHTAIYFVSKAQSFDEAMELSFAFAGQDNYCPVLAGPLAEGRWLGSAMKSRYAGLVSEELREAVAACDANLR